MKRLVKHALLLGTALSCSTAGLGVRAAAAAPVLTTLVSFTGPNGALPLGTPTFDLDGNLYGTTGFGGSSSGFGQGTVFELSGTDHTILTTLVSFNGANGTQPQGGLVFDIFGNLFGTTTAGGPGGDGTAFELSGTGHETLTTLTSFNRGNGASPFSGLAFFNAAEPFIPGLPYFTGQLFGTTETGGAGGYGTVFELSGTGHKTATTLASFDLTNGASPESALVADRAGNLYGTTTNGGAERSGTVFELSGPGHSTLPTLATFNGTNGVSPRGGLSIDAAGNLFGTTEGGGPGLGGTIFELAAPGHTTLTTLATFGLDDPHGAAPVAPLLIDAAGNLFGTTTGGGVDSGSSMLGTVFKLSADHKTLTTLYSFTGQLDGAIPNTGLTADLSGNLYGTTASGGAGGDLNGDGTVFKLSGTGFVTILDRFGSR